MEFDVHKKGRFCNDFTQEEYLVAREEYLRHLAKIDFSKSRSLLKYFGDSFFHDAEIISMEIIPVKMLFVLKLFTINDLEDINDLRQKKHLSEIPREEYIKAPILYNCVFRGVLSFSGQLQLDSAETIMDSELHNGSDDNDFRVLISFSDTDEIDFTCRSCVVKIVNEQLIVKYTGGNRKSIPYCALCRSKLVTNRSLNPFRPAGASC